MSDYRLSYWPCAKKAKFDPSAVLAPLTFTLDQLGMTRHFQSDRGERKIREIKERYKVSVNQVGRNEVQAAHSSAVPSCSQATTSTDEHDQMPTMNTSMSLAENVVKFSNECTVTLILGSIVNQQADVIVNSTNKNLDLNSGGVSRILLQAAGPELQKECTLKAPKDGLLQPGEIVATLAYNLDSEAVYHGIIVPWHFEPVLCELSIRKLVQNALTQATSDGHTSIALPALGTGLMKVPLNLSAQWMFTEVEAFSKMNTSKSVMDVRFVVYPTEKPTVDAFQAELTRRKGLQIPKPQSADKLRCLVKAGGNGATATTMTNSLQSTTGRRGWNIPMKHNITLEVYQGDLTLESVDAIVCNTNKDFDFTKGYLSASISAKAGSRLQESCELLKDRFKRGPVMTSGFRLPCTHIVHMNNPRKEERCSEVIEECLTLVQNKGLKSIAFPLIGTGLQSRSVADMASIMLNAITSFCSKSSPTSNLSLIRIVIFDPRMVGEFAVALDRKGDDSRLKVGGSQSTSSSPFLEKGSARYEERTVFRVNGKSQEAIQAAMKDLKKYSLDVYTEKVLDSDLYRKTIAQLSDQQVARIQDLEVKYLVKIVIEKGLLNRICINGELEVVVCVQEKIFEIFHNMKSDELQEMESKTLDSQAQWMFKKNKKDRQYFNYPEEINTIIERSYQNNMPAVYWTEDDGSYSVNFNKVLEYQIGSVEEGQAVKRTIKEIDLPETWDAMIPNETFLKVRLKATSPEFKTVAKSVKATAQFVNGEKIIKIERIQNSTLYKQYLVRKSHMKKVSRTSACIERSLWHGSSFETTDNINQTGFNRSYCGKNATAYGRGVYFARDFFYSAQDKYSAPNRDGQKSIYQSLVLTGEFVVGHRSYIEPPLRPGSTAKIVRHYDSVVDDVTDPGIFVIFSDAQAYPEYLITFK